MVERYYNKDNELGVLYSPDYGAGWSTWAEKHGYDIALDKRIIEYYLKAEPKEDIEDFMKNIGYGNIYCGGWDDIKLAWIPQGTVFRIGEYDGWESIIFVDEEDYVIA